MSGFKNHFRGKDNSRYGKRHKPGEMNRTEQSYADELHVRKCAGEIVDFWFERMTFKLADDCRYTPDFTVLHNDGSLELIDTKVAKAATDPKSVVKMRMAAELFFMFRFVMLTKRTKKAGGGWETKEF